MANTLIYTRKNLDIENNKITINKLSEPQSLDEFNINIIDLKDSYIWQSQEEFYTSIDCIKDLINLGIMVKNSSKTRVIVVLPQDLSFCYCLKQGKKYALYVELKNIIDDVRKNILNKFLDIFNDGIIFEPTKTKIDEMDIEASFYFIYEEFLDEDSVLTKSIGSEKARTIAVGGIVIITLNLQTEDEILGFLKHIEFIDKEVEVPPWVEEIKMLDDIEQDNIIEKNKEIIREAKGEMCVSQEILEKNNR